MLFIDCTGLYFESIIQELNIINQQEKPLEYELIYNNQFIYPNLFKFEKYMVRYPGSNASLERLFSSVSKFIPSWRYSKYKAETYGFHKGKEEIVQILLLGLIPETESFYDNIFPVYE